MKKRRSLGQIRQEAEKRNRIKAKANVRDKDDETFEDMHSPDIDPSPLNSPSPDYNNDFQLHYSQDETFEDIHSPAASPTKSRIPPDYNNNNDFQMHDHDLSLSPQTSPDITNNNDVDLQDADRRDFEALNLSTSSPDNDVELHDNRDSVRSPIHWDNHEEAQENIPSKQLKETVEDDSSDDGGGDHDDCDNDMENVEMALITDTGSIDVDKTLVIRLLIVLKPLKTFLSTRLGGGYSETKQSNCALRLCNLLVWTALNSREKKILDEETLLPWMEEILRSEYPLVDSYCQYLEESKLYSATTIRTYLYDYGLAYRWFVFSYNRGKIDPSLLLPIQHIIKQITKNLNDSIRRSRSERTVETDLLARKLPPNGMQELMTHVEKKMTWARTLVDVDFRCSDNTYRLFTKLLFTSIYTESNNGN
jgi:hypothetical protein